MGSTEFSIESVLWLGGITLAIIFGLAAAVKTALERARQSRARPLATTVAEQADKLSNQPSGPKCICHEPATRPVSRTHSPVTWWTMMRVRLGMRPVYKLHLPEDAPLCLCDVHGRVWDAKLRRQCEVIIATKRAEAEEAIAVEMAALETESLMLEMVKSLTFTQRNSGSVPTSLVPVRTVTNGKEENAS